MAKKNWLDIVEWDESTLEDLRFVGYTYIKQGHYSIALKFFENLVKVPRNPDVYDVQTLGALYLELNNNVSALHFLEKALGLDPSHEPTLINRAKALFVLGYRRQGLSQLEPLKASKDEKVRNQALAMSMGYS